MGPKPVVAFDVEGTLRLPDGRANDPVVAILKALAPYCEIVVWSSAGADYASDCVSGLGLQALVDRTTKKSDREAVDLTFDDSLTMSYGAVNICVRR